MDDSLLTKCPHCQTLFRIQQEHLAAAGGEVRCGVCYKVFDANGEGVAYSQGEGSPAQKTFAKEQAPPQHDKNEENPVIDTSPEPEPNPLRVVAESSLNQSVDEAAPSLDELQRFNISSSSITEVVTSHAVHKHRPAFGWAGLSLLAVMGLFGQWLYVNFEKNAHHKQWHSLYVTACKTLGCQLPLYQEVSAIKTDRLAIKIHPDYDNVLIVDMIISNSARQTQPLPVLEMAFYTINGDPLAQRLFQPEEYLGKHLKQLPVMPTQTPVHLSFAILDPGSNAVNYSVNFSPAS